MNNLMLTLLAGAATASIGCSQCLSGSDLSAMSAPLYDFNTKSLSAAITASGFQSAPSPSAQTIELFEGSSQATTSTDGSINMDALLAASTPAPSGSWPHYTPGKVYQITIMGSTMPYVAGDGELPYKDKFIKNSALKLGRLIAMPHSISQQSVTSCDLVCGGAQRLTEQTLYGVDASYLGDVTIAYDEKTLNVTYPDHCTVLAP